MKWIFPLLLVVGLVSAAPAAEQGQTAEWHWIMTSPVGERWEAIEGLAKVEIGAGTIHVQLLWSNNDNDPRFDIAGSIRIGKVGENIRGVQEGTIAAIVTRLNSDIRPSEFTGTYRKAIYGARARESFGVQYSEIIIISDPVSMIGLTKLTK